VRLEQLERFVRKAAVAVGTPPAPTGWVARTILWR
jgi:hypothetical protein